MNSNYSKETSLPAYEAVDQEKDETKVLRSITKGNDCLLKIAEDLNKPQSSVSGRVNDLIQSGKAKYDGFVTYKDRKRKSIALVQDQFKLTA